MDRPEISRIAHTHHPIAAPVSPSALARLVDRALVGDAGRVVDLGCGAGEWLFAALDGRPGWQGVGVDLHLPPDVADRASARGVGGRVEWVQGDAAAWSDGMFEAVLCVGASHAFGGTAAMLDALQGHVAPGGRVVVGDGFWERPPSAVTLAALDATPDDFSDLADVVHLAEEHGWAVTYGHTSTVEEWDEYEWSWTGSLTEWSLTAADRADREQAREAADAHRRGWLRGYRGELGFVTLVLAPSP